MVNPSSVIPTWINSYWPEFYIAITNQEDFAINNFGSAAVSQFSSLAAAFNGYKSTSRADIAYTFTSGIYSYKALNANYGLGTIDLSTYIYKNYFSFGTFGAATLSRPVSYYDDFIATSPKLTTAINYINNTSINDEKLKIEADQKLLTTSFQGNVSKFLYENPTPTASPIDKTGLGHFIFDTLLYKRVYQQLNVAPHTLPPYIT